jgi:hypothetical protein
MKCGLVAKENEFKDFEAVCYGTLQMMNKQKAKEALKKAEKKAKKKGKKK